MEEEIEEYGTMYSTGVLTWPNDPEIDRIYPLEERITHAKRMGQKVLKRRIIIVEDWEEA